MAKKITFIQDHTNPGKLAQDVKNYEKFSRLNAFHRALRQTFIHYVPVRVANGKVISINDADAIQYEENESSTFTKLIPAPNRHLAAAILGFKRSGAYFDGSVRGVGLLAWDIITWAPTFLLNVASLVTEVPWLAIKNVGEDLKKEGNVVAGWALIGFGGFVHFLGSAITSPSMNIQRALDGFKNMSKAEKAFAIVKVALSIVLSTAAWTFIMPMISMGIAALAAVSGLGAFTAAIACAAHTVIHGISAIEKIKYIGEPIAHALDKVGGTILKGLNQIPFVDKFVSWIMPAKPVFVRGQSNLAHLAAQAQAYKTNVEVVARATAIGAIGGYVASTVVPAAEIAMNYRDMQKQLAVANPEQPAPANNPAPGGNEAPVVPAPQPQQEPVRNEAPAAPAPAPQPQQQPQQEPAPGGNEAPVVEQPAPQPQQDPVRNEAPAAPAPYVPVIEDAHAPRQTPVQKQGSVLGRFWKGTPHVIRRPQPAPGGEEAPVQQPAPGQSNNS